MVHDAYDNTHEKTYIVSKQKRSNKSIGDGMPRCGRCGEWFIGDGELCMWCKMREIAEENIKTVRERIRAEKV